MKLTKYFWVELVRSHGNNTIQSLSNSSVIKHKQVGINLAFLVVRVLWINEKRQTAARWIEISLDSCAYVLEVVPCDLMKCLLIVSFFSGRLPTLLNADACWLHILVLDDWQLLWWQIEPTLAKPQRDCFEFVIFPIFSQRATAGVHRAKSFRVEE